MWLPLDFSFLRVLLVQSRVTKAGSCGQSSSHLEKSALIYGRWIDLQAVTSAVPIYTMQTAKLPVGTCEDINKINRKGALNLNLIWLDGTKFVDLSSLGSWD